MFVKKHAPVQVEAVAASTKEKTKEVKNETLTLDAWSKLIEAREVSDKSMVDKELRHIIYRVNDFFGALMMTMTHKDTLEVIQGLNAEVDDNKVPSNLKFE